MSARDAILAKLKGAAPDKAAADALLIAPERPAVDTGALEAEFLARLALPSVSASHDAIDTVADLPAAVARYLAAQGEPQAPQKARIFPGEDSNDVRRPSGSSISSAASATGMLAANAPPWAFRHWLQWQNWMGARGPLTR